MKSPNVQWDEYFIFSVYWYFYGAYPFFLQDQWIRLWLLFWTLHQGDFCLSPFHLPLFWRVLSFIWNIFLCFLILPKFLYLCMSVCLPVLEKLPCCRIYSPMGHCGMCWLVSRATCSRCLPQYELQAPFGCGQAVYIGKMPGPQPDQMWGPSTLGSVGFWRAELAPLPPNAARCAGVWGDGADTPC